MISIICLRGPIAISSFSMSPLVNCKNDLPMNFSFDSFVNVSSSTMENWVRRMQMRVSVFAQLDRVTDVEERSDILEEKEFFVLF